MVLPHPRAGPRDGDTYYLGCEQDAEAVLLNDSFSMTKLPLLLPVATLGLVVLAIALAIATFATAMANRRTPEEIAAEARESRPDPSTFDGHAGPRGAPGATVTGTSPGDDTGPTSSPGGPVTPGI